MFSSLCEETSDPTTRLASATPETSRPASREPSMTAEQIKPLWGAFPSLGQYPHTADQMRTMTTLNDMGKQAELSAANSPGQSRPSKTEARNDKSNNDTAGLKPTKRTLTLHGPRYTVRPTARPSPCHQCHLSGSSCRGSPGQACGACVAREISCSRVPRSMFGW